MWPLPPCGVTRPNGLTGLAGRIAGGCTGVGWTGFGWTGVGGSGFGLTTGGKTTGGDVGCGTTGPVPGRGFAIIKSCVLSIPTN